MNQLIEDKKAFWRYKHAHQCFDHAAKTTAQVLKEKWPGDHPLIYQISVATVVLYARPFSNCYGIGKLDEEIIPKHLQSRHRRILGMRDKVFAHHDTTEFSDKELKDLQPEVKAILSSTGITIEISEITLTDVALSQVQELAEKLVVKCRWHLERLLRKYKKQLPKKPGSYRLKPEDQTDFFSP